MTPDLAERQRRDPREHWCERPGCREWGGWILNSVKCVGPTDDIDAIKSDLDRGRRDTILLQAQAQLEGWRVDFLAHAPVRGTSDQWQATIIECDGHDFHERTKEQAERDRARDREFQARGFKVFRFTGSELWRDPLKCSSELLGSLGRP